MHWRYSAPRGPERQRGVESRRLVSMRRGPLFKNNAAAAPTSRTKELNLAREVGLSAHAVQWHGAISWRLRRRARSQSFEPFARCPAQMQAADQRQQPQSPCQAADMIQCVHRPGVSTAGDDNQNLDSFQ